MARLKVLASSAKKFSKDLEATCQRMTLERQIQAKAHELYLKRGCTPGNDWADWFEAEKIVLKKL